MANPDAEKLWKISLCIPVFYFHHLNNFSGFIASKVCIVLVILLLRSLKKKRQ
jgi:hypothetical protein